MKMHTIAMTLFFLAAVLAGQAHAGAPAGPVAIAIHAGAGSMSREDSSPEIDAEIRATLEQAVRAGHEVLTSGGSSLDAVSMAVTILEDAPFFNAGRGAVFNSEGVNELDASIMDGRTLNAGAVAGVHNVRNPVLLARKVMSGSAHVMLAGPGAEAFAREQGIVFEDDAYFRTERRWQQLQEAKAMETAQARREPDSWLSTVGAVALDAQGNLAAATSTGGMTNKRWGRIGDVPVIGAGTYADNNSCAVSATGHGEYFIRATAARDICARIEYTGASLQEAADQVVMQKLVEMGGRGGIIAVDPQGHLSLTFNTSGMHRASVDTEGELYIGIYNDE
ncbi:MAG: isoaspartyl peptidase/L-asparaginase [Xanthomonadales bacterium]|jgi:beta-aspartyl-peptidase (threonine type)|nr:isoaspartyl peptidase/L-asparaginase [Xanthomonadales bacterium]